MHSLTNLEQEELNIRQGHKNRIVKGVYKSVAYFDLFVIKLISKNFSEPKRSKEQQ